MIILTTILAFVLERGYLEKPYHKVKQYTSTQITNLKNRKDDYETLSLGEDLPFDLKIKKDPKKLEDYLDLKCDFDSKKPIKTVIGNVLVGTSQKIIRIFNRRI